MRDFIFRCRLSLGDIVLLTAAIRDLQLHFPATFRVDVRTCFPDLWAHNPYLTPLDEYGPGVKVVDCALPLINQSSTAGCHCIHGFIDFFNRYLGTRIQPTAFRGDIHLSRREKAAASPLRVLAGADFPFWLICAGGKYDCSIKWWDSRRYQAVVDHFSGRVQFVQVGDAAHYHPKLRGAIDLRGRTSVRDLIRLVYHADGVLCGVTSLMHLAAAVPVRPDGGPLRPCVVVAGGRESPHWEAYPEHQFIHTVGALPCCARGGCWKARTVPLGDGDPRDAPEQLCVSVRAGLPRCMDLIGSEEVARRIETYLDGGAARSLTRSQARAAARAVAATGTIPPAARPLNFHTAPELAQAWLARCSPYGGDFAGRGIVISGGGVRLFTNAWVCIRMLRHVGCSLPIELWYFGERELDARMRALVAPLGVECVDGESRLRQHGARLQHVWALKPFAVLHSRFREVLLLDADNVPVANPEPLFRSPAYDKYGAVFWPDFGRLDPQRPAWKLFGVPYRDEPEIESGQVLVNKEACWRALNLCLWYNLHAELFYDHVYGDKETFHLAFRKLLAPYAMPRRPIYRLPGVMCQHDFQGHRLFQHRSRAKWNLHGPNRRIPGFWFEPECRRFLKELAAKWDGQIDKLRPSRPRRAAPAAHGALRLFPVLISSRDHQAARQRTLANLAGTDWGRRPLQVQFEEKRFSCAEENTTHAAWLALRTGLSTQADYLLLLAEDLEFNRYFLHNLRAWPLLHGRQLGCASLTHPGSYELARFPACRAKATDPRFGLGFEALLLSRPAIRFLLDHWSEGPARLDLKIGMLADRWDWPAFCHWPALVRSVGLNHGDRRSSFNRAWQAPHAAWARLVSVAGPAKATRHER
jgi:ADP-heptose:LPS heptosyltransferase